MIRVAIARFIEADSRSQQVIHSDSQILMLYSKDCDKR